MEHIYYIKFFPDLTPCNNIFLPKLQQSGGSVLINLQILELTFSPTRL